VHLRYLKDELLLLLELLLNAYCLLRRGSSYAESFFGYTRAGKNLTKKRLLAMLLLECFIPYFREKIRAHFEKCKAKLI
jgi:hypothetical protein